MALCCMLRVDQNQIHTVYIGYFWQGNHQMYGHIRCILGISGREITKFTVIYGAYMRIWPTLPISFWQVLRMDATPSRSLLTIQNSKFDQKTL